MDSPFPDYMLPYLDELPLDWINYKLSLFNHKSKVMRIHKFEDSKSDFMRHNGKYFCIVEKFKLSKYYRAKHRIPDDFNNILWVVDFTPHLIISPE